MKTRCTIVSLLLVVFACVLPSGQAQTPRRTVWNGIYTAEQAVRGEASYKQNCSRCHGASLEGTQGNGLVGKDFMDRWREDSMGSLFQFVSESMPPIRRGQGRPLISIPTYLDIVAFVLSKNDFPAGPAPLAAEGLDDVLVQYKDGPQPLPNGALVRISGCLTGSGQNWMIESASDPIRTRTSETTDYGEFHEAETANPGKQNFKLFNMGMLGNVFKPEGNAGAKLLVKGNLIRQTDSMRISVLAIRKVADTCP